MSKKTSHNISPRRRNRRAFLKTVLGGTIAVPFIHPLKAAEAAAPRPDGNTPKNLIFIVADTFRADHLGCYGSKKVKTPCLDELASESVRFTNSYADGLPTIPCRRVYSTGKSIVPMRKHGGWIPIKQGRRTLPQVLGSKGFTTGFIADTYHYFKPNMNFHVGFDSWQWIRGQEFDHWRSGPRDSVSPKEHMPEHLWHPGYDRRMRQYLLNIQDRESEEDYFCAQSFLAGLKWLKANAKSKRFMLWIDTFDPHEPWDAPQRFRKMYYDKYPCKDFQFGYGVRNKDIRPKDIPAIRALYSAEVSFVDMWIGRFIEGVRKLGLLDDTIIVFTTDHGTHLGAEGCVQKTPALLNSSVANLPLIVRHPDRSTAGKRIDQLVAAADYMPAILDMLDVKHKLSLDGDSFWKLVEADADSIHDYVITEFGGYASVRDDKWHYFQDARGNNRLISAYVKKQAPRIKKIARGVPHLYDLENDPGETKNVVLEHPEVVGKMQERLKKRILA